MTDALPQSQPISVPPTMVVGLGGPDAAPAESVVVSGGDTVSSSAPLPDAVSTAAPAEVDAAALPTDAGVIALDAEGQVLAVGDAPPELKSTSEEPVGPSSASSPPPPAPLSPSPTTSNSASASLLQILVSMGALTPERVEQIELTQIREGTPIEDILKDKQLVSEEALTKAKAEFNHIPFVRLEEIGISPEALTQLPEGVARKYAMLPFTLNKQEHTLAVAMSDPLDLLAIEFAEQKSGLTIIPHYAMPSELERLIAERYAQSLSSEVTQALKESGDTTAEKRKLDSLAALTGEVVRQAPITKIVETVISFAIKARASDIHIEPQLNRTRVRYRIDGILMEKLILPSNVHDAVVSRIKILSDLKIDEKRIPQDGRFTFMTGEEEVDLRISTLPTIHGEKIVMRLLKKNASVPTLNELGLGDWALSKVSTAIKVPHGIVLVTGPTGSGKTTTLYSVLHNINTPKVNIMTLEDPVEYQMPGINQVQINPQAGLTFASGLRSFLRQDPNIIMVGEIRDSETVELAIQAALTGHLVFSTLHTSSAAGAIPRLIDMGAEPFLLASSMTLTMAQRIVRCLNEEYKEEYQPEQAVIDDIKAVLGERFTTWCEQHNQDPATIKLYRTKEDRPQTEPEYHGRVGIFEVMPITEEISHLILERKSDTDLEKAALRDGMLLMKQDGYLKALEGVTSIEEVLRVAQV
jgi:type IV pilus assembly protein PilB